MSVNDQFNMGRLPIRPLSLTEKALAQTKEILIDNLGENPTYHIYIVDANDRTKLIDITELIIKEAFPMINADNFKISIDGILDAQNLKEIINFIYKRFLMPDDPNGFDYEEDHEKIYDPLTKSVLLKDTDNIIYLPITTADNVYTDDGITIQDKLDGMTKVGFSTAFVKSDNYDDYYQSSFEFEYPFPDYSKGGNYIEVRIGSTYIDNSRYEIIDEESEDGHIYKATLNLINESLQYGRTINLLFIYNTTDVGGTTSTIYGGLIANNSIPYNKLQKISDKYTLADSTSVASSKAIYNLYKLFCDKLNIAVPGSGASGDPDTNNYKLNVDRFTYTIKQDKENTITFDGLQYVYGDEHTIFVYKNGIRLFESIDYSMDADNKNITVFVNTEKYDRFVFEYHSIEKR